MEAAAVRTHAATFVGRRRDLDHWIDSKGAILVGKRERSRWQFILAFDNPDRIISFFLTWSRYKKVSNFFVFQMILDHVKGMHVSFCLRSRVQ
jgi:hypothetical protein